VGDLLGVEFLFAALIGAGGGIVILHLATLPTRVSVAGDCLVIAGALIGVVFAGFALVIAIISDSYMRFLNETVSDGVLAFLRPFIIVLGVQIATILVAVFYRALAADVSERVENIAFVALLFLFVLSTLELIALARSLLAHGVARAELQQIESGDSTVKPLRQPRRSR
jgi:hypothetical protein